MIAENDTEILLVEDSPYDAELTIRELRRHHLANKVVLLDLKLPKVDGLEVLRAIKTDERTRTIPVVVMSSSQEQRDVVDSYHLGVNSYVVKPVDFDHFSRAVSELGCYWVLLNHPPGSPPSPKG